MYRHHIFFVLICAILCNIVYSKDCNCECKPKNQLFTCDCKAVCNHNNTLEKAHIFSVSSKLFAIPRDGNVQINMIEYIKITNIDIPIFNSFEYEIKMENLTQLTLKNCSIQEINKIAFNKTRYLTHLNMEKNLIIFLSEDMFIFVKNLRYLNLRRNSIEDIPEYLFRKLPNLTEVYLSYNNIQYLPDQLFNSLNNLTYIHLDNNQIKTVPPKLFANNKNLGKIYLNNNNIHEISKEIFQGLTNVYEIYLEMNQIKILPNGFIENLSKLQSIKLDHNNINIINSEAFMNNPKLKAVFLNNNYIKNIHHNIISTSPKLKFLNLSNNEIICDCKLKQFFFATKYPNLTTNVKCFQPKKLTQTNFVNLTLNDFVCPPKILKCTSKKLGNITNISCKINGNPTPIYVWIFKEKNIINNEYYKVSYGDIDEEHYWANLTIFNVTLYTKGNYTLNVTSKGGNDQYIYEVLFYGNEDISISTVSLIVVSVLVILIFIICIVIFYKRRKYGKYKPNNPDEIEMYLINKQHKEEESDNDFDISITENEKPDIITENEHEKTEIDSSQLVFQKQEKQLEEEVNNMLNHVSIEENNNNHIIDDVKDKTKISNTTSQSNIDRGSIKSFDNDSNFNQLEFQIPPEKNYKIDILTTTEKENSVLGTLDNDQLSDPSQNLNEQGPEYSDTESEYSLELEPIEEVQETSDDSDHEEFEYLSLTRPIDVSSRLRTNSDSVVVQMQANTNSGGFRNHTTSECSAEHHEQEFRNIVSDMQISCGSLDYSMHSGSSYIEHSTVQQTTGRISNVSKTSISMNYSSTEKFSSTQTSSKLLDSRILSLNTIE